MHAIQIVLPADPYLAIIVWPDEPHTDAHCRLINLKWNWLTCRAGDAVLLRPERSKLFERKFIQSVKLFRVYPMEFNGMTVESVQNWLAGEDGCFGRGLLRSR